jgi:hypothetical protein
MTTDEEDYGRVVLTPLREDVAIPAGPSRVDVAEAIVLGRRRIRVRRLIGAGCAAVAVLVAAAALPVAADALRRTGPPVARPAPSPTPSIEAGPAADPGPRVPTTCTVRVLPAPDKAGLGVATGVDPTGRLVLGRTYVRGVVRGVVVWTDEHPRYVDVPGIDQRLVAANSAGAVVGESLVKGVLRAWQYEGGQVRRLDAQTAATATAINESGVVVGARMTQPDGVDPVPVMWPTTDAAAVDLARPGRNWFGRAVGVSRDGTVVGALSTSGAELARGYLWSPWGELTAIPLPVLDGERADGFTPISIGDRWVTGRAFFMTAAKREGVGWRYVRYDLTTRQFHPYPDNGAYLAAGNADGWLVGAGSGDNPVLVTDAGRLDLPLVGGLREYLANGLSADGRVIVGQAYDGALAQGLIWRCR